MSAIAIIPARGGSKRIPRKNIRDFCGKPIIAYSIEVALQSGLFNRVIVSTDDREIADVSQRYGADIPFMRPKALADDYTGTHEVMVHALERMIALGCDADYVCCIYPTAPFL
ncbi:MAG: pseudaminic acid cytidylyltransferase, partial [Verrucomicrobiae bacterium]|nr:pseudaminic acid cytidylyltransferase [Verrucomicrobiae bacterium]